MPRASASSVNSARSAWLGLQRAIDAGERPAAALRAYSKLSLTDRCGNSPGSWRSSPTLRCHGGRAVTGLAVDVSTRPASVIIAVRGATSPAITSSSVVLPAPDGPKSASRSPGATARLARIVKSRRSTSTSASSTGAPYIGGERQRQRDDKQDERERQRRRQARLLQRRPYLQRKPSWMVGDDDDGAERSHRPRPRDRQCHRKPWR